MKLVFVAVFAIADLFTVSSVFAQQPQSEAFAIYQQVISGAIKFDALTPQQKQQVMAIHALSARTSCGDYRGKCADACEAANKLASAASDLERCAKRHNLSDDCSRRFKETKYAFSDYESAISEASGDCN
jgi:hypothetical protein